ncbi:chemotaxis protein CheD [Desulfitibacter alkalitolerans]|uniref:chemotaxis protein CheD n=1 Tax=Desulfitibacter alkalitolerans TaxID=264641 RepID=UPI000554F41D|nr:chemotaxis protein CheD [Desulfitibacter alkalitolerans]
MINAGFKDENIQEFKVGIADLKVTSSPHHVITLGLGSCVGIVMFDKFSRVGGMVHIMLPDSTQFKNSDNPAKFADTGINLLLRELLRAGGKQSNLVAKIAGGAQMFKGHTSNLLNIGERNIKKTKDVLHGLRIPLAAEDTGGNKGRTMILQLDSGKVLVRTVGCVPREI